MSTLQLEYSTFLIWMTRSFIYFHKCPSAGKFCKEYNFIRTEIGLLKKYISESILEDNESD